MDRPSKRVNGIWLPADDEHYAAALTAPCKRYKRPVFDGRPALGWHHMKAALEVTKGRRVFVDAGAHVGLWSMWMVDIFRKVHAFEPMPAHCKVLMRNVAGANASRLDLHRYALGDGKATVLMKSGGAQSGRAHIGEESAAPDYEGDDVVTEVRPLDSLRLRNVDLIKIDVEGYEVKVLMGAEKTIRDSRPTVIVESVGWEQRYGETPGAALDLLRDWGAVELRPGMKGDYFFGWAGE